MPATDPNTPVARVLAFLEEIGIGTTARHDAHGFLSSIDIVDGTLHYNPGTVRPSDLLHEAGHLAVIPAEYRGQANGDLDDVIKNMLDDAITKYEIDSTEMRRVVQSGEVEATAWSYAAGVAIGLELDDIIHPDDYDGAGAEVRLQLQCNSHFGINGLRHGGMIETIKTYPTMLRWTQP